MSLTTSEMTPADFGAIMGNNGNNGTFGDGSWWIIILFLFIFAGWGGNGLGNGSGSGAMENYVLNSDFSELSRQLDSATDRLATQGVQIANGLCDGFYTQAQLINGVTSSMATQGYETRNAITQAQIAEMQNANAIQSQLASCCCDNRAAIADVNYNMATQANGITNAINNGFCSSNYNSANNTRDIIDAQNAGTQAILQAIQNNKVEELQNRIAEQNQQISALQLSASQAAQNNYLISQLKQAPIPAYTVPNPYSGYSCGCNA